MHSKILIILIALAVFTQFLSYQPSSLADDGDMEVFDSGGDFDDGGDGGSDGMDRSEDADTGNESSSEESDSEVNNTDDSEEDGKEETSGNENSNNNNQVADHHHPHWGLLGFGWGIGWGYGWGMSPWFGWGGWPFSYGYPYSNTWIGGSAFSNFGFGSLLFGPMFGSFPWFGRGFGGFDLYGLGYPYYATATHDVGRVSSRPSAAYIKQRQKVFSGNSKPSYVLSSRRHSPLPARYNTVSPSNQNKISRPPYITPASSHISSKYPSDKWPSYVKIEESLKSKPKKSEGRMHDLNDTYNNRHSIRK